MLHIIECGSCPREFACKSLQSKLRWPDDVSLCKRLRCPVSSITPTVSSHRRAKTVSSFQPMEASFFLGVSVSVREVRGVSDI